MPKVSGWLMGILSIIAGILVIWMPGLLAWIVGKPTGMKSAATPPVPQPALAAPS